MALREWPVAPRNLRVAGFSGQVIRGAAGLKSPLFHDKFSDRYFVGDPGAAEPPALDISETEVLEYEERGLVTRCRAQWTRREGGVILYAHQEFLSPSADGKILSAEPDLKWDDAAKAYIGYLERTKAVGVLWKWGNTLLSDAKERLRRDDVAASGLAWSAFRRARFCAPLPENKMIRQDAFVCGIASRLVLDNEIESLKRDARRDYDTSTVNELEKRARRWLESPQPSATIPPNRSTLSWANPST